MPYTLGADGVTMNASTAGLWPGEFKTVCPRTCPICTPTAGPQTGATGLCRLLPPGAGGGLRVNR